MSRNYKDAFNETYEETGCSEKAADAAYEAALCTPTGKVPADIDDGEKTLECRECLQPITVARYEAFGRCCSGSCLKRRWL